MLRKSEDGLKIYCPHRKYQRVVVQSCAFLVVVCLVCYTYVNFDEKDSFPNRFRSWNVREVLRNTIQRIGGVPLRRERKFILLWTPFFSAVDWLPSTQELKCPISECDVTSNRSFVDQSSALILHWRNINPLDLPSFLSANASAVESPLVAVFNKESPSNTPVEVMREINDKIHVTITYRRDSDFFAPYGRIEKRENIFTKPKFNTTKRSVCWLVSNCETSSNRETYVSQLKAYIDVDIYGNCGTLKCPHKEAVDCYRMLAERCKFYLSFENSICKDYVTEKLFYALKFDMVPIVLGGNDYSRYLPDNSFINVADYDTPKDLANYLLEVANDEAKYMSYFKWKETHEATHVPYLWLCDLCQLIHENAVDQLKRHNDVISWWFNEANCGSV